MGDKMRDPRTGRYVKSGTELSVPVRDSDDEVIENLRERLGASARRVHDLEKIIKDQDNLIDRLQSDAMKGLLDVVEDASTYVEDQETVVPAPKRGYRLIAWGLAIGGCILFWYGVGQFFFGGK